MATFPRFPRVQLSALLRDELIADGFDPDDFAQLFSEYKHNWPSSEYRFFYFGKDGASYAPLRDGKTVLCHVHLPPPEKTEEEAIWEKAHLRGSRKTSDTILIYTQDSRHGYLLLYIARYPAGHATIAMSTQAAARLMNNLADAAQVFIDTGKILL